MRNSCSCAVKMSSRSKDASLRRFWHRMRAKASSHHAPNHIIAIFVFLLACEGPVPCDSALPDVR